MASSIWDPLAKAWLEYLKDIQGYASLHFEMPNPDDPSASEVDGTTYSRAMLKWDWADNSFRTLWNNADCQWLNLEQVTIVAIGVWSDPTKGELLVVAELDEPIPVPDRGSYTLDAKSLFVHV